MFFMMAEAVKVKDAKSDPAFFQLRFIEASAVRRTRLTASVLSLQAELSEISRGLRNRGRPLKKSPAVVKVVDFRSRLLSL